MVDAPEHVGKPSLRIDIVELGRVNERQHHSGALPTAIVGAADAARRKRFQAGGPFWTDEEWKAL